METLLIIGIDTVLGANLGVTLANQFGVCGVAQSTTTVPAGTSVRLLPDATPKQIRQLVTDVAPRWIIHSGALARSSWEATETATDWSREAAWAANFGAVAKECKIPLCFLSTDAVFSGPRLFHEESARATGMTALAVAARNAELSLESSGALVVRTHAYGWNPVEAGSSFLDGLWHHLSESRRPVCDGRHYATPILASDLAQLLVRAYEQKLHGMYHITGAERTNRVRFANELAAATGAEIDYRSPLLSGESPEGTLLETSLNTRRARRDLEVPMPLLREGLERLAAQRVDGYLDRLRPADAKSAASHAA